MDNAPHDEWKLAGLGLVAAALLTSAAAVAVRRKRKRGVEVGIDMVQRNRVAQRVPDAEVGAQARPDLAFADVAPSQIFHVDANGDDSDGMTRATAWRTIKKAANSLKPGQAAYVHAGIYLEQRIVTGSDGRADAPIRLMAARGEKVVIQGDSAVDAPFFQLTKAFWIVDGFEIAANQQIGHAVRFDKNHHAVVKNIHAHHGRGNAAISIFAAQDVALLDSMIHEYTRDNADSHGVIITPDCERVLVKGNRSWKNGGDSVQCVGPDDSPELGARPPRDILIEENRFYEDVENAVDLKTCHNVTVRRNKCYGYRAVNTAPGGAALVVHRNASGILIEENRIWNSGMGASMGASTGAGQGQLGPVVFRRNLIFDMQTERNGVGAGIRVAPVQAALKIYHNTFYNIPNYAIRLGDEGVVQQAVVINNIVMNAGQALEINTKNTPTLQCDRNLYFNAPLRINGQAISMEEWQQRGQDGTSRISDPLFVDDPRNNDFFTKSNSPARDRAISLGYAFCFDGPDIGFLESCF